MTNFRNINYYNYINLIFIMVLRDQVKNALDLSLKLNVLENQKLKFDLLLYYI